MKGNLRLIIQVCNVFYIVNFVDYMRMSREKDKYNSIRDKNKYKPRDIGQAIDILLDQK